MEEDNSGNAINMTTINPSLINTPTTWKEEEENPRRIKIKTYVKTKLNTGINNTNTSVGSTNEVNSYETNKSENIDYRNFNNNIKLKFTGKSVLDEGTLVMEYPRLNLPLLNKAFQRNATAIEHFNDKELETLKNELEQSRQSIRDFRKQVGKEIAKLEQWKNANVEILSDQRDLYSLDDEPKKRKVGKIRRTSQIESQSDLTEILSIEQNENAIKHKKKD